MKVKQLIEFLQTVPDDADVKVWNSGGYLEQCTDIEDVVVYVEENNFVRF